MTTRGDPRESATENIQPMAFFKAQVMLKWCGKSAPRSW